ncbi:MAG: hypothetical protein H6606_11430 [Flavobacteriales bacterium]|nr:hypothetical protein [Flavobacteriales bacterium]
MYAIYKEHNQGFYLNDNALPTMLFIEPGYSADFIKDVVINEDIHSIKILNRKGGLGVIPCLKVRGSSNIYYPIAYIREKLTHVVEGYSQPIWVEFSGDIFEIDQQFRGVYVEMLEAISYWIWQITDTAKEYVDKITSAPLTIKFDFADRSKFENIQPNFGREPGLLEKFEYEVGSNELLVKIPEQLTPYLYGSDNEGEQVLVKAILTGLRLFDAQNLKSGNLSDEQIDEIILTHVPLGLKKKIFILFTENEIRLDPRGLDDHRYIQKHNVEYILDEIVPRAITSGIFSSGTKEIEDGYSFIRNLVSKIFLPWLDSLLEDLNCENLLGRLFRLNEALIRKRMEAILTTPTRIACFVSQEQQIEDLNETLKNVDQTSLSVRCLIEHIAASPSEGKKIASKSEQDQLLALMEQIIAWGMLGDQMNFGLAESKITVLESARIGTDHSIGDDVFSPFSLAKAKENVTDAISDFEENFAERDFSGSGGIPEITEKAFAEEFGVTLTRILEFSHFLVWLAFEMDPGCTVIYQLDMKEQAQRVLENLSDKEFNALMSYYSLDQRDNLMKLPAGYFPYDVFPWRYNRGLALIRKPIVRRYDEERKDYLCYYGPRQAKIAATQTLYLFYSGKLRCTEGGSLSKLIGDQLNKKGAAFTQTIYDYVDSLPGDRIVDKEVPINQNKFLKADKDLGDIDVLVIDHGLKMVILLECKKTEVAKNVKQLVEEVNNLFGSDSEKGWIDKHEGRFDWIKDNLKLLGKKYGVDISNYSVVPVILTSEELPTKYLKLKELPFEMVSFYLLKEVGLECMTKAGEK